MIASVDQKLAATSIPLISSAELDLRRAENFGRSATRRDLDATTLGSMRHALSRSSEGMVLV
ncbi:hypothetical protein JOD54_002837 [Actinokineospora baliensis]|uniref:hypothetical protein n=1 Tax=Actinokineospora baliensis TaxID=547056 RepID=UPI001959C839|nr:hypothetical protein [Actinokineospora baliensis]MBM7772633.1 hypothetical protein [Actinokineospora baliensis]